MTRKYESLEKELNDLILKGRQLYYSMANDLDNLSKENKEHLKKEKFKYLNFYMEYDPWYSEAIKVVKQIIPERLEDFVRQYKNDKRKDIDYETYCISDYLIYLQITRVGRSPLGGDAALPKMRNQWSILSSAANRFDSKLFDIKEILQADIFDNELETATELCKKGFLRGAGAITGVVLEAHLSHVCENHGIKSRKKNPTISDFNDLLKKNDVIDTPQWRHIQHLGDLRNLCDHNKDRDPTKDDVNELIEGVGKIIKTLF